VSYLNFSGGAGQAWHLGPVHGPVGVVGINKGKHIGGPLRAASTLEFGLVVRPKKATEFKSISYFHSMYLSF